MGAMNVFYSVGFWWGVLVLVMDIGKGAAAVAVADALGVPDLAVYAAGVVSVLGHSFPLFLGFKGGKGGATCIGVLFYLMPQGIPIAVGVFALILLLTRYPTVSYSVGLLAFPFVGRLMYQSWELTLFSVVLLLVPFIRYLPRLREMRSRAGNWGHVFKRRGLGDRL